MKMLVLNVNKNLISRLQTFLSECKLGSKISKWSLQFKIKYLFPEMNSYAQDTDLTFSVFRNRLYSLKMKSSAYE